MDYLIEKLDPKDYAKCSNIWNMNNQPNAQKWYHEIVSGNRVVYIYKIHGEFIGEGALVFQNGDPDYTIEQRRLYLSRLIVKREYRSQGIGGIIVDHLIHCAQKLGYQEISLGVNIDNLNALHLYEKKGFTHIIFEGADEQGKYVKLLKKL